MKTISTLFSVLFVLSVSVSLAQPVADFSHISNCYQVDFTDQSTCNGCNIVSWNWDFGDGSISNQQNPTHYFPQSGPYSVQLTVTTDNQMTDAITMQVDTAGCVPIIVGLTTDTTGCAIDLIPTASGGVPPFSYLWSNGSTIPQLSVSALGTYTLTIVDSQGSTGNATVTISSLDLDGCSLISGRVFEDLNNNGIDDGEPGIPGIYLRDTVYWQNANYGISNNNGDYTIYVDATGQHSVDVLSPPTEMHCNALYSATQTLPSQQAYSINLNPGITEVTGQDFGFNFVPPGTCGTINGNVFLDDNQNGILDGVEGGYFGLNIRVEDNFGNFIALTQTDANGDYEMELPMGSYNVIAPISNNQTFYCNYSQINVQTYPSGGQGYSVTLSTGNPSSMNNDFGLYYQEGLDAGIYSLWPDYGIVAGEDFNSGMDWKIFGTVNGSCALRIDLPPLVTFVSAMIPPTNVGVDFVEWVFTNPVTPIGTCMGMTFHLDATAVAGDLLTWEASFTCTSTDGCPGNNNYTRTCEVQEGPMKFSATEFSPVSKIVVHTGNQETGDITHNDSTFCYIINFQNVTTDTARHVRIVDQISPYLDIKTISQPFSMSPHKFYVLDDQTVIWEMDEIAMPDTASSYPESYSFVQYNIRMKQNLPAGTVIENSAWVYFNREDSIMTNITQNTIVNPDNVEELEDEKKGLSIYPNPTNNNFYLVFDSDIAETCRVEVIDMLGQSVYHRQIEHNGQSVIAIAEIFAPGSYLVTVTGSQQKFSDKVTIY